MAVEILLEWRELFKRGCPVSNFIEAKTQQLLLKLSKVWHTADIDLNALKKLEYFENRIEKLFLKVITKIHVGVIAYTSTIFFCFALFFVFLFLPGTMP